MRIYIYGDILQPIVQAAYLLASDRGHAVMQEPDRAHLAIAPLLTAKLTEQQIKEPHYGTLIFHPSLLPRHRGRDSIKWAYKLGETYTGGTWFWADSGLDTGDICEQEVLAIDPDVRPREFYEKTVIPSAMRMLDHILEDLDMGIIRKRRQQEEHSSYERPFDKIFPKVHGHL